MKITPAPRTPSPFTRALAWAALPVLGALAFTPACGGASATSLCDAVCDCRGCSESEYEECIDGFEDTEKAADEAGCSSEFSDFASCVESEVQCRNDEVDIDGCEAEAEALSDCGGGGTIGGDACDELAAELNSCEGVEDGGSTGGTECTEEQQALAACYLDTGEDLCTLEGLTAAAEVCN